MARPSWELDPIEGSIYPLIDGERQDPVDTVNIGGKDYRVNGGRLQEVGKPSNFYNLGRQGSSYLTPLERGGATLSNQIRFESLNDPVAGDVIRGYSGSVTVEMQSGDDRVVNIEQMAVAPQGGRIYVWRPDNEAEWRFEATSYGTLAELSASMGILPNLRWATALEVAQRAVGRALLRDSEKLITDYARDQGLYKENGEPDFSGAFHMLLDQASISMDAARSARVIPGG